VQYVGERIRWFFENQKEAVLAFMDKLEGTPGANLYSPLYPKHAKLIKQNEMIKHLLFQTYDRACQRQLQQFVELFDNMLTSGFSNPWVFLRNGIPGTKEGEEGGDAALPSFEDTKERLPKEVQGRAGTECVLSKWLADIPTDASQIDEAVEKVQTLVVKTYSFIRSQVCDQVELFAESFFKFPMMRRLEEDMAQIELTDEDEENHQARRYRLEQDIEKAKGSLVEIDSCISRIQSFKMQCGSRGMASLGA